MIEPFAGRMRKLQKAMREGGADVCVVLDRENLQYFGGIEQVECLAYLIPVRGEAVGLTMSLDLDFVKSECAIADIRGYVFPRQTLGGGIAAIVKSMGFDKPRIGFERYFVPFAVFRELSKEFDPSSFMDASPWIYKLRASKTAEEIARIRKAAAAAARGMDAAVRALGPGACELDIAAEAEYASMKAGSEGTPFRPQVVSGPRTLTTHPFASEKRLAMGELVLLHLGARYRGYTAKLCRTAFVGPAPEGTKSLYRALAKTQEKVVAALRPGVAAEDLVRLARASVETEGYGSDYLGVIGYGVGLRQSEFYPVIASGNTTALEADMVVDVLMPTIYHPEFGGPRLTDTILITPSGPEYLTDYPRDLIEVAARR
jgi:Xaa-Pro aminopeptidase